MLRWLIRILRAAWDLLIDALSFLGLVGVASSVFEALGGEGFFSPFVNWLFDSIVNYPMGWGLAVLTIGLSRHFIFSVPQEKHQSEAQKKRKRRAKFKRKGRRK